MCVSGSDMPWAIGRGSYALRHMKPMVFVDFMCCLEILSGSWEQGSAKNAFFKQFVFEVFALFCFAEQLVNGNSETNIEFLALGTSRLW